MTKRKKILIALFALAGLLAWAYSPLYYSGSWRYRITVNVETPEGMKSGSAVREVRVSDIASYLRIVGGLPEIKVKGEAVVVDLGKRGILFAVMNGHVGHEGDAYRNVFDAFPYPGPRGALSRYGIRYYDHLKEGFAYLAPEKYPKMVMFRDLENPMTAELVYGVQPRDRRDDARNFVGIAYNITDQFEDKFGEGVKIKNVAMEMVRDPVTRKIDQYLPWLPDYFGASLDGQKFRYHNSQGNFPNSLTSFNFSEININDNK